QFAWSPDGCQLAVAGWDGNILVYDAENWKPTVVLEGDPREFRAAAWTEAIAWSPDGRLLAAADGRKVAIWDVAAQKKTSLLSGPSGDICCLSWSPDGQRLASGAWDRSVVVWETRTWQEVLTLTDVPPAVAWSPDGRWLATGGRGNSVRVWGASDEPPAVAPT